MSEPTWKKLVEQLRDKGHKSPYLDRLRERLPAYGGSDLAAEILREMASALGRSEDKINAALLELEVMGQSIDALVAEGNERHRAEIRARVAAFNEGRERAEKALWELRVHREALGFRRNDDLATHYPIPPRRST
ncbi:hypothetical protein [Polyangium aurulentum]|uniref:hypothetical protein n=1 Tax=Polyangium aurulentum TaxID=2567896 RepID=UPI0010ADEA70|nr:hypothetical protein [Polyangium aurulentum]UQA60758.1 hypothetical protein E8A73_009860 [Polyangium aurulentum]